MSEEYIVANGFSSLDIETCDGCHHNFFFLETNKYQGETFCNNCLEEIKADLIRDERKGDNNG